MAKLNYGPKLLLDLILRGEMRGVMVAFPEWGKDLGNVAHAVAALIGETNSDFERLSHLHPLIVDDVRGSQKAFAALAEQCRCPSALFAVRSGKSATVRDHIRKMDLDQLLILIDAADLVKGPETVVDVLAS